MNWKEPETLYFGSCKIIIHRPELNDVDKARIEHTVKNTLEAVMRNYISRKDQGYGNQRTITEE